MKEPYSALITIKIKGSEFTANTACFGNVVFSNIEYFLLKIDTTLSIEDVLDYFNFLESFIPKFSENFNLNIDSKKRIVTVTIKKIIDNTTSNRKKNLTIFTLLRYIQEFPEIVKYLCDNGFSWENFAKAHGNWNKLSSVKYRNAEHSISTSGGVLDTFCDKDTFIERFKTREITYIRDLFKK